MTDEHNKPNVKEFTTPQLKNLQITNQTRELIGLPQIVVKVRRCITCQALFESTINRNCGCNAGKISGLNGHDIT